MGLFGKSKSPDPKEQVNEWCKKIRKEGYGLDRQIRQIQREEAKVKRSLKDAAKRSDKEVCRVLAKEIVGSRKAVNKIYSAKANLNSVEMLMKNEAAQVRLAGSLSKSTEVMQAMQQLIKLPEISQTMREMSTEMMKAGIIEEMLQDVMEGPEEELEDEVQEAVDKVIAEITLDDHKKSMDKAPSVPEASIDIPSRKEEEVEEEEDAEEEEKNLKEMQERLQALRS